jgi:hypothetical protein
MYTQLFVKIVFVECFCVMEQFCSSCFSVKPTVTVKVSRCSTAQVRECIHNLFKALAALSTCSKPLAPISQDAEWTLESVWTTGEESILSLPRIEIQVLGRPTRRLLAIPSELYRQLRECVLLPPPPPK